MNFTPEKMRALKIADYARRCVAAESTRARELFRAAIEEGETEGRAHAIEFLLEEGQLDLAARFRASFSRESVNEARTALEPMFPDDRCKKTGAEIAPGTCDGRCDDCAEAPRG